MLQFEETKSVAGLGLQHGLNAGLNVTTDFVAAKPAAATVQLVAPSVVTTVQVPESFRRIRLEDKRIINGKTDVNQLVPFKYKWAWEEVPGLLRQPLDAAGDQHEPRHRAVEGPRRSDRGRKRRLIRRNLGFFTTADSLAANNIVPAPTATSPRPSAGSTSCDKRSRRRFIPTPINTSSKVWRSTKPRCLMRTMKFPAFGTRTSS